MRSRVVCFVFILFCILAGIRPESAQAKESVSVSADSAIVMDVQSGTILYEKNIDKKEYPASITKIMTALVALENSSLSETVTYSKEAVTNLEINASNISIQPGEKLSMEDSLYAILMMSANEACNGVAEHVAGSIDNFVKMMNQKAKELGCTGTHFANANGLWMKNHYTTAHDMALIARAAYRNPTFAKITGTKQYNIGKTNKYQARTLYNHHGMLYAYKFPQYLYEYCVGGKTGYTEKCRYTLVTYAKKNNMTLLSVVMKVPKSPYEEPNEYTDSTKLLNYGFNRFKRVSIVDDAAGEINSEHLFTKFSPFYSTDSDVLSIDEDAGIILPKKADISKTEKKVEYYDTPVEVQNEDGSIGKMAIGKITYTYKGKEVGGSEIYYQNKTSNLTLTDSFDMSEWFDDAVEEANKDPFPWKTFILVLIGAVLIIGGSVYFIIWFRAQHEMRTRRNRYKKSKQSMKNSSSGVVYKKK
jgi:D-alanyl-D-alanine carboxypeptidase